MPADLSNIGLGFTDLVEPHKLLVSLPPVVGGGTGRLYRPLTPLPPELPCMLEKEIQTFNANLRS